MGKRSNFERKKTDFYPTPESAVLPLFPHICGVKTFDEPCAGDGALVRHLERYGYKAGRVSDAEPRAPGIEKIEAFGMFGIKDCLSDCFITNPPWSRESLHQIIEHLSSIAPTWLLFDADWMHTKQAIPFQCRLVKIVSVGRVVWIEGSGMTGKDNCAWYLFDAKKEQKAIEFWMRAS